MLSIEDCLELLDEINWDPPKDKNGNLLSITNLWDRRFISDVSYHTRAGKAISTAQGTLALKLIQRYHNELAHRGIQVDALVNSPHYRLTPHVSTNFAREVRWIGDSKLAFRCKYNPTVGEDIKKLKAVGLHAVKSQNFFSATTTSANTKAVGPRFDKEHKLWIVSVDVHNVNSVIEVIRRHCFKFDDAVTEFLTEVSNSRTIPSSVELVDGRLRVSVRNNEFMNAVLNDLEWLR